MSARILIVKLSSLGDIFHALPAVHALKTGLNATVDWVVQTEYLDCVRHFTDVTRAMAFHRHAFFRNLPGFLSDLRAERYDLIVDLQGILKSACVLRLARGTRRIGPSFHREGAGLLYPEVAGPRNRNRHAVEENLDVVRHLGLPAGDPRFPLDVPDVPIAEPRPRIGIVPSSRWPSKNWPVQSFIVACRALRKRAGVHLFLFGGGSDSAVTGALAKAMDSGTTDFSGRTTIVESMALLRQMDLVIANDTGPMHVAAALGVPVVALFGPTDPVRTGPYGGIHRVIRAQHNPCAPCFETRCRKSDHACMAGISPDAVVEAVLELLDRSGGICEKHRHVHEDEIPQFLVCGEQHRGSGDASKLAGDLWRHESALSSGQRAHGRR